MSIVTCEEYIKFHDAKSISMISDFKIFPNNAFEQLKQVNFGILWVFFLYIYYKGKTPLFEGSDLCNLNWLLNLNLIYETLWTGVRSGLLISMLGKLSWFRLTGLITMVLLMWKWMGLFLRKNHLLRYWGWLSLLNWIGALTLSLLLKLPPKILELWRFFLLKLLCISVNLPYSHVWNNVVTPGLVAPVATWNC